MQALAAGLVGVTGDGVGLERGVGVDVSGGELGKNWGVMLNF